MILVDRKWVYGHHILICGSSILFLVNCTQPENSEFHSKSQKAKKSKSFTFGKKLHFSTFRAKIRKVALFAKSCTFRLFG